MLLLSRLRGVICSSKAPLPDKGPLDRMVYQGH